MDKEENDQENNDNQEEVYSDLYQWDFDEDELLDEDIEYIEEIEEQDEPPLPNRLTKMKKIFAMLVLIIFATTALSGLINTLTGFPLSAYLESLELTRNSDIKNLREGVVLVNSYENPNRSTFSRRQTGTGFNIDSSGKIVTNRHVVQDSEEITISFHGVQETFTLEEWEISPHPGLDLAVVDLPGSDLPYLDIAEEPMRDVSKGEEVLIIGNPRGVGGLVVEGKITGINSLSELPHVIMEIDTSIHPGHSGSPVFNEEEEIIGIIYASRELADGTEVGLAISLESYGILQ